ncbi:MAG: hypothetical protein LJE97_12835, partial [Betaproteobacteria bacterium]|nr:hypothetical protein [Betaproteobacteria bacterium]
TAVLLLAAGTALGGCAVGNKHAYTGTTPDLAVSGTRVAVVAVRDARPYVMSGNRTPDFAGLTRGESGSPLDILTESGNPLAVDFGTTIAAALRAKGFKATVLEGDVPPTREGIAAVAKKAGAERLAVVLIEEWQSDTLVNTTLAYDLDLEVYDSTGKVLGATRLTGRQDLGGDAANPPGYAKTAVPAAYRRILEQLFSAQPIVSSLK